MSDDVGFVCPHCTTKIKYTAGMTFGEVMSLRHDKEHLSHKITCLRAELAAVTAERDALLARLAPVDDESRHLTAEEQKVFHSALRRSAKIKKPVDDEALVEIAAREIFIERRSLAAAIAAIRPHIEAAERERCAKAAKGRYEKLVPANEAARNFRLGRMTAAYEIEGKLKPSKTPPDTNTAQIDVREFVEKLDAPPQQSGAENE